MTVKVFGGGGPGGAAHALVTCLSSDAKPDGDICAGIGLLIELDTNKFYRWFDEWIEIPVGGSSAWGNITGTLSDQTDLQSAFNGKSAAGHNHDSAYATTGHHHDADYAAVVHTHPASEISDSTAVGRSVVTAADQAAARDAIGAAAAGAAGGQAFPVGSVFIAVVATDPATLLGYGTWSAFGAGKVLIGRDAGDAAFDTAEETGGAKTVAAAGTVSQPTFSGAALGTHAHAAGTLAPSAHSGTAVADHASHTHTYSQVPNHVHVERAQGGTTASTTGTHLMTSTATGGSLRSSAASTLDPTGGVATGTTNGPGAALTHSVTQPAAHTMSGSSEAVSGGTPAGTVSQPTFTGSPTSVVQPYIVVYMWKRTA